MKLSALCGLAYFVDNREAEKIIIESVREGYVNLRIDHHNETVTFRYILLPL